MTRGRASSTRSPGAPELDIEIGEMFTGRSLPPGESWQAQAYRLDLEEV